MEKNNTELGIWKSNMIIFKLIRQKEGCGSASVDTDRNRYGDSLPVYFSNGNIRGVGG